MKTKFFALLCLSVLLQISSNTAFAGGLDSNEVKFDFWSDLLIGCCIFFMLLLVLWLVKLLRGLKEEAAAVEEHTDNKLLLEQMSSLDHEQVNLLVRRGIKKRKAEAGAKRRNSSSGTKTILVTIGFSLLGLRSYAQSSADVTQSPGMLIMLILVLIPLLALVFFICLKVNRIAKKARFYRIKKEAKNLINAIDDDTEFYEKLVERKNALDYKPESIEPAGKLPPDDTKGLLHDIAEVNTIRFFAVKRKAAKRHDIDPRLVRLILWYLVTATFWLVLGTSIGEYLGIKFVSPDVDHVSWLSFGRLRPVHTNMVFWGWSSLAMIGLGYYVVSTVSSVPIYSLKKGYQALVCINMAVVAGSLCLMSGINNGGGEYREYTWPVMSFFALGIIITLYNYIKTIALRKTKEIYISNWYIVAALMFLTTIALVGYIPFWQNGIGDTITQGYYMHQAVGMWFMLFNLGLIYYFLPQQLNTPIYSYSLGILAFWSQILFYTLIGTHHFIFSSIPWWLQTVAIVGSMGMLIPVFAGTTNFLLTFRDNYHKIARSYTLPFYLTGIIFYFTGSTQGTAEAFRATNLVWHFTDFTVAHSHLTMYGIIAFMLWASIYTLVPRLTGKEPKQGLVGAHFWLALIGVLFYTFPLMIGGTLKGMSWMAGKPFIEGVINMGPFWLWRAIGGSLMLCSHFIFAWNLYTMIAVSTESDIKKRMLEEIQHIPDFITVK